MKTRNAAAAAVAVALLAVAGCSNDSDNTADSSIAETVETVETTDAPETSDTPATTATEATEAPLPDPEVTPETTVAEASEAMQTFAAENPELLLTFGSSLVTFADEAANHLADVSKAPSAAALQESAAGIVAAIGPDETDADLVVVRDFAAEMSASIEVAAGGDPTAAVTRLLAAQANSGPVLAIFSSVTP